MNSWSPLPGQDLNQGQPMTPLWWEWFNAAFQMQDPAAPGSVTQLTSKATTVALDGLCGQIVTNAANLLAGATVSFTMTNASIKDRDIVVATQTGGTANTYTILCTGVSDGSCRLRIENFSGVARAEAITINFRVLKAANT